MRPIISLPYPSLHLIWLEGWEGLPIGPRLALISLAYNLGGPRLASFVKLRAALRAGDLPAAANQALDSKWAGQVGRRAQRNSRPFTGRSILFAQIFLTMCCKRQNTDPAPQISPPPNPEKKGVP